MESGGCFVGHQCQRPIKLAMCVCVCVCRNNGITARLKRNGYGGEKGVCGRDWKSKQEPQTAPDASTTQIDANICISTQYVE